jgi:hypothetical protein
MRSLLTLLICLVWVVAGAPPVRAANRVAPEQFLISFWCGPPPEETTLARYQEIADAGFNVVLPPCRGPITPAFNQRLLQLCALTGLKAIVSDPRLVAAQAASPASVDVGAALDGVVRDYAGSPALLGYYLKDEPAAAEFPTLAALSRGLRARDPWRLPYINLFPNYATPAQLGTPTYPSYLDVFVRAVHPGLLSFDHYALLTSGERPNYFENLEAIRREALQAGIPFAYILRVTPHGPYRDPSEADLRWQVYSALAYGAHGILYFTYWTLPDDSVPFSGAILDHQGLRTAHYYEVQRINSELSALAPTLVQLRSTGVYHTGTLPSGTQGLPPGGVVRSVNGGDALIGLFQGPRLLPVGYGAIQLPTSDYILLANRSPYGAAQLRVTLQPGVSQIVEISRSTGQPGRSQGPDTFGGNSFSITLAPGDGRLFALLPGQGGQPPIPGQGGQPPATAQGGQPPATGQGGQPPVPGQNGQSGSLGRRWRMILGL